MDFDFSAILLGLTVLFGVVWGLDRLFLHAWRLELTAPGNGELIRATAELPDELESVLDGLRGAETAR